MDRSFHNMLWHPRQPSWPRSVPVALCGHSFVEQTDDLVMCILVEEELHPDVTGAGVADPAWKFRAMEHDGCLHADPPRTVEVQGRAAVRDIDHAAGY